MKISFKLLDSNSTITNKILDSIKDHLQPVFSKTEKNIQLIITKLVKDALMAEPEYNSLLSGQLRSELGIADSSGAINQIFDAWSSNVIIRSKPITIKASRLSGGFGLDIIKSDFSDVLSLPAATTIDSISGSVVPWLQWLLLDGNKILVRNYRVQFGPNSRSRTGNAIMVTSEDNWRVPPQFAGTINNNWVTRAIDRIDSAVLDALEKELESNL